MKAKKRILLVDNSPSVLDVQIKLLKTLGCEILTASSVDEAVATLESEWVNLIISDIRLVDDVDPEDISGLLWIEDEKYNPIPKILLSGYTEQYLRETLNLVLKKDTNIQEIISKKQPPAILTNVVGRIFDDVTLMNWNLVIRRNPSCQPTLLFEAASPNESYALLSSRIHEFEDMLRKLFREYDQVAFGRMIDTRAGYVLLEAYAYDRAGREEQFVVSCGTRAMIADELERARLLPRGYGSGRTRWVSELEPAETLRFAATAYQLVDADLERITSLAMFYRARSAEDTIQVLKRLYESVLTPLYNGNALVRQRSITDFMSQPAMLSEPNFYDQLLAKCESLCKQLQIASLAKMKLVGKRLEVTLEDGVPSWFDLPAQNFIQSIRAAALMSDAIHGCIDGNAVRVDDVGNSWVINFTATGPGEIVRDFVSIEYFVKYHWLRAIPLKERCLIEQVLIKQVELDDIQSTISASAHKALTVILYLRTIAARFIGDDFNSYLIALYARTLELLDQINPIYCYRKGELEVYGHALYALSLINQTLKGGPQKLSLGDDGTLWLDTVNQQLSVDGVPVDLTNQEYKFIQYLYQNKGNLCTRQEIEEALWGQDAVSVGSDGAIDAMVTRLRSKVEVVPREPKYIITVRGRGFKLMG